MMPIVHSKLPEALQGNPSGGTSPRPAALDHVHSSLNVEQLLFHLIDADMNVLTDQEFDKTWDFGDYLITEIRCSNPSINLTAADGGIYNAAAKANDPIVAAAQVYTTLDATDKGMSLTLTAEGKARQTALSLFLSLTGTQGVAATADFYIFGIPLTEAA